MSGGYADRIRPDAEPAESGLASIDEKGRYYDGFRIIRRVREVRAYKGKN